MPPEAAADRLGAPPLSFPYGRLMGSDLPEHLRLTRAGQHVIVFEDLTDHSPNGLCLPLRSRAPLG